MSYKMLAVLLLSLSACNEAEFETEQVQVSTSDGTVTCQLYRRDIVLWDRALTRPSTMTDQQANQTCWDEGLREKSGAPVVTGSSQTTEFPADSEPPL